MIRPYRTDDELIHEAPAIVGRDTPSALAHTPSDLSGNGRFEYRWPAVVPTSIQRPSKAADEVASNVS
jgi:hypothetical protein